MKLAVSNGHEITADQAIEQQQTDLKCPQCNGRVRVHRKGKDGQAAHFEHLSRSTRRLPCQYQR